MKEIVRSKYSQIARESSSCCGVGSECGTFSPADEYKNLPGYVSDADLSLGCGIPQKDAAIRPGDTVVDLGSGAGNDAFTAAKLVTETGRVVGVDFSPDMIDRAHRNREKIAAKNVDFIYGDIEDLPLRENFADVVISNCVLNLVPDKSKAFREIERVLKPGGHFAISDIVLEGEIPEELKSSVAAYTGCVSGAVQKTEYLEKLKDAGFEQISIAKQRKIEIPRDILDSFLNGRSLPDVTILSVTVTGHKSAVNSSAPEASKTAGSSERGNSPISKGSGKLASLGIETEGGACCGSDCCN